MRLPIGRRTEYNSRVTGRTNPNPDAGSFGYDRVKSPGGERPHAPRLFVVFSGIAKPEARIPTRMLAASDTKNAASPRHRASLARQHLTSRTVWSEDRACPHKRERPTPAGNGREPTLPAIS